jgi:competence protein ComEC
LVLPVVAFVAGIGLLQVQPELPSLAAAASLALVLAVNLALCHRLRPLPAWPRAALLCAAAALAGFLWAAGWAQQRLSDELPSAWEGRDVRVIGVVARLPQRFDRGVRFELDVERVLTDGARVPQRVLVSW